ncbi:MAG TPA: biotin carboxylase, partial [Chryseolinea sp.]|nr:biotin carboxylase [Chryseolinea sp.]
TGLETTLGFCQFVMKHEAFRSGNFDTRFVENYFTPSLSKPEPVELEEKLAAVLATTLMNGTSSAKSNPSVAVSESKWKKRLKV